MGFLKKLRRKKVPEELPDLAADELREKLKVMEEDLEKSTREIRGHLESSKQPEVKKETHPSTKHETAKGGHKESRLLMEKSFFDELLKNVHKEMDDLDKLEQWYNHKFLPQDVVHEMREYWESKKSDFVIQTLGKHFKDRISEKVGNLQDLEKEWQGIYFDLTEKEEEMRKVEGELKKILAEFTEVCKRKKDSEGKTSE